ncbi:TatD DNase family protein [Lewinella marina]|uniref:Hydrolase TatD n=1 Tax=Neolewinella marina TaxID=438751 RepID=A0A2G0CGX0_9BACT|nr:TatD family hydrolase [Neolewinella marina]NJB86318.1 TatD DNase family protein [Neolewinella marina]PHK99211.1 hydrolase TatD [Neolewinella marina]
MLIDTHTHLYSDKFAEDRSEMLERAWNSGVGMALLPAIDRSTHAAMLELEAACPDRCLAMIGLHPVSVGADYEEELAEVERYLKQRRWVAIGEIGMDLYWDKSFRAQQEDAFLRQCQWAIEYDLPISIHAREAIDNLLELIEGLNDPRLRGVFHCFTGDARQAARALDLGFYLGIGGVLTFKNGGLEPVIRDFPKNRVLLETDSPYLAPTPHRGKRNETAYLPRIAEKMGEIWNLPTEEVGRITTDNARQLFDLDQFADLRLN